MQTVKLGMEIVLPRPVLRRIHYCPSQNSDIWIRKPFRCTNEQTIQFVSRLQQVPLLRHYLGRTRTAPEHYRLHQYSLRKQRKSSTSNPRRLTHHWVQSLSIAGPEESFRGPEDGVAHSRDEFLLRLYGAAFATLHACDMSISPIMANTVCGNSNKWHAKVSETGNRKIKRKWQTSLGSAWVWTNPKTKQQSIWIYV